jgi:hypothetical protein
MKMSHWNGQDWCCNNQTKHKLIGSLITCVAIFASAKLHRKIPAQYCVELKRQRRHGLSDKWPQEVCLEYYRITIPASFPCFLNSIYLSLSLSLRFLLTLNLTLHGQQTAAVVEAAVQGHATVPCRVVAWRGVTWVGPACLIPVNNPENNRVSGRELGAQMKKRGCLPGEYLMWVNKVGKAHAGTWSKK